MACLPLVKRVYSSIKVSLPPSASALEDDLLQCGALGLLQALESWDRGRGVPFEAWARLKIRGFMLDELRRQDYLSKNSRRRWKALRASLAELEQRLQRPCDEQEWADHLGVSVETLREDILENSPGTMLFLDGIETVSGRTLAERLADPGATPADAAALREETLELLKQAISALPPQEHKLLALLLDSELGHKEAALVLGISPGRVSQIYAKAVLHLQVALARRFGSTQV